MIQGLLSKLRHPLRWLEELVSPTGIWGPVLVLLIGLAVTASFWRAMHRNALATHRLQLEAEADQIAIETRHLLRHTGQLVKSVKGFVTSSMEVTPEEWSGFTADIWREFSPIAVIDAHFIERVRADQLGTFVGKMRTNGQPEFTVWPMGNRDEYWVVKYDTDRAGHRLSPGLDLATMPTLAEVLERSAESGRITMSRLFDPSGAEGPILVCCHATHPGSESRTKSAGWVVLMMDPKELSEVIARHLPDTFAVQIADVTEGESPRTLMPSSVPRGAMIASRRIEFGGRVWEAQLNTVTMPTWWSGVTGMAGLCGVLLSLLAAAGVRVAGLSADRRIAEAKGLHMAAIEAASDVVVITNVNGVIEYVNPAFTRCTGYAREEALGATPSILRSGQHERLFYDEMWGTVGNGHVWQGQIVNRRKDGSLYTEDMTITPVRDRRGAICRFVAIKRDITDRLVAEAEQRRQSELLSHIMNTIPNFVFWKDRHSVYQGCNMRFAEAAGLNDPDLILGKTDYDLPWTREEAEWYRACDRKVMDNGEAMLNIEETQRNSEGDVTHVLTSKVPLRDDDGHVVGILGIFADITEHKAAQAAIQERETLEKALRAMEQMLGVVAHELRTPLAAMRVTSEMLLEDTIDEQLHDQFLHTLHDESVRMGEMVNNMLEATRLSSGKARWDWGEVDVSAAVRHAMSTIAPLVSERVSLDASAVVGELTMRGDTDAIHRLIINLVTNAHKHTTEGTISVSTRQIYTLEHPLIEIEVRDTGSGIEPTIISKLGEAFALNSGVVGPDHITGSGLGLTICKGIVAAHGGTISVASELGRGATFTVRLRSDLDEPADLDSPSSIVRERVA